MVMIAIVIKDLLSAKLCAYATCKILFKPLCGSIRWYYTHFPDELIEAER